MNGTAIDIDQLAESPGCSEYLGDDLLEILQGDEVVPTPLVIGGRVAAWIMPADAHDSTDAEPDLETAPAHLHHWKVLGAQPHTPFTVIGKPVPHTIVLGRCTECGEPDSWTLPGEWTLDDLRAVTVPGGDEKR